MVSVPHKTIQEARRTDLPAFLLAQGESLKRRGKRWQHQVHDSLWISGNMFYWNSKQEHGNSVDFVMKYYGWSFAKAIQELTGADCSKIQLVRDEKILHIVKADNCKKAIAYLCKTRKIDYSIVINMISQGLLCQDQRGNAVFVIRDENGETVGAELVGTLSTIRFKGMAAGTKVGYGFTACRGDPIKTLFFESPIDLMSFWTINKDKIRNNRLVSLGGLRGDILNNTINSYQINPNHVYLCPDNDEAARNFIRLHKKYKTYLPPAEYKDWNDQLREISRTEEGI